MNKPTYKLTGINQRHDGLFQIEWVEANGRKNKDLCNYENVKDYLRICKDTKDATELAEFKKNNIENFLGIKPKRLKKKEGKDGSKADKQEDTRGGDKGSEDISP